MQKLLIRKSSAAVSLNVKKLRTLLAPGTLLAIILIRQRRKNKDSRHNELLQNIAYRRG